MYSKTLDAGAPFGAPAASLLGVLLAGLLVLFIVALRRRRQV